MDFGLSRLTSLQFIQYHVAGFYKPTIPQSCTKNIVSAILETNNSSCIFIERKRTNQHYKSEKEFQFKFKIFSTPKQMHYK
jgi:hypothetical protein